MAQVNVALFAEACGANNFYIKGYTSSITAQRRSESLLNKIPLDLILDYPTVRTRAIRFIEICNRLFQQRIFLDYGCRHTLVSEFGFLPNFCQSPEC